MKKKIRNPKENKRIRRHKHVRQRVAGTPDRPRVCVFRSNSHIYAQIIDDEQGRTLAAVSSLKLILEKSERKETEPSADQTDTKGKKGKKGGKTRPEATSMKILQAREVGRMVAEVAKEKGITAIRFDRGGYLYHGRVAALAEAMREGGLEF